MHNAVCWREFIAQNQYPLIRCLVLQRSAALACFAVVFLACGDGRRSLTGEAAPHALTVRVQTSAALAALGKALGWPGQSVPGATVIAERVRIDLSDEATADTALSDSQGFAHFPNLAFALYQLRVARTLSTQERASATDAIGDAETLVGATSVRISAAAEDTIHVALTSSGGSSLVLSEIFPAWPTSPSGQQYYYGGYFEIYNNADTLIRLADKLWIDVYPGYLQSPQRPNGCTIFLPIERDARALWFRFAYRFPPGSKALRPGEAAILVTDAIDHRPFGRSGFFDLSRADFEFRGASDTDNPLVQNMIEVGARTYQGTGHGYRFLGGRQVWALVSSVSVDTLPRWTDPVFGGVYTRIPVGSLLDVVRYDWNVPNSILDLTFCPSAVASTIDAADAVLLSVEDTLAIKRRVARTRPDGRVVFQRSRNSAADWITGPGTPGKVP